MGANGAEAGDQVSAGNLAEALVALGRAPQVVPDTWVSPRRFADGAAWHIEIPSVEGPAALSAVVDEARRCGIRIDRISQGSGIGQLSDEALIEMAALGRAEGIETVLWAGARAGWDISAMARSTGGASSAGSVRGERGLGAALEEAVRAARAGISGVLMADVGVLRLLGRARGAGVLPEDFVLKTSIALPTLNAEAAECYVELGATSLNLPTDLPLEDIAAIRRAVDVPLDCYIEGADDFAAPLRYHELAEIVTVAAPVHIKFGLRNVAGTYPAGGHLAGAVIEGSRERVRRSALGVAQLERRGIGRA